MKISRNIIFILLALVIALGFVIFSFEKGYAAHGPVPITPRVLPGAFGGKIHNITNCHVDFISYAKKIDVGPPLGGESFMVVGGIAHILDAIPGFPSVTSKKYDHKRIEKGQWVLGSSSIPPIPCKQCIAIPFVGIKCIDKGSGWLVNKIGTSNILSPVISP